MKGKCEKLHGILCFLVRTTGTSSTFVVTENVADKGIRDLVIRAEYSPGSEALFKVGEVIRDPEQCAETNVKAFCKIIIFVRAFTRVVDCVFPVLKHRLTCLQEDGHNDLRGGVLLGISIRF